MFGTIVRPGKSCDDNTMSDIMMTPGCIVVSVSARLPVVVAVARLWQNRGLWQPRQPLPAKAPQFSP